ncbi:acyltransferase [Paenibacillus chibensis]|uniref:acyltransferase n=1 Tax=Paenibacillus chibensis TaxID=59846 RepID=UPI001C3FB814|nr:acyltransferase [Paenibacillus chibensis]MEC0369204.1 acyltransferase [Paenibacillus chibensis]
MWKSIEIGERSFINRRCFFDAGVRIGEDCDIGFEVMFCTSTHQQGTHKKRAGIFEGKQIHVGNGCWIGARALLLPGVIVGDGCIVAAGSVITKDCLPNGLYAGVPAKRIKDLI